MSGVNKVFVLGNLGQDPELRYTQNQVPVVSLSVATNEVWFDKEGKKQEHVEWHRVVVWQKQAEACSKYLKKGSPVHVEGRLKTRTWEDKDGAKRYTTEIHADYVQFLGGGQGAGAGKAPAPSDAEAPAGKRGPSQERVQPSAGEMDPSDIPF